MQTMLRIYQGETPISAPLSNEDIKTVLETLTGKTLAGYRTDVTPQGRRVYPEFYRDEKIRDNRPWNVEADYTYNVRLPLVYSFTGRRAGALGVFEHFYVVFKHEPVGDVNVVIYDHFENIRGGIDVIPPNNPHYGSQLMQAILIG